MAEIESFGDFERGLDQSQEVLWDNGNPGRWLAIGRPDEGIGKDHSNDLYLAYSFGGRSDPSKNRMAVMEDGIIRLVAPGKTAEDMTSE